MAEYMEPKEVKKLKLYADYTILDNPIKFNEWLKDSEYIIVEVHSIEKWLDTIVGYVSIFGWEKNKMTLIDGDQIDPKTIDGYDSENPYTGFLLNGSPYQLRGACMHSDLINKANALTPEDIDNDFDVIQDLGANFLRLVHYPHPKQVYDYCDKLGIVVQTEAPWLNKCL